MKMRTLGGLDPLEFACIDCIVKDGQYIIPPCAVVDHMESVPVFYANPFWKTSLGIRPIPIPIPIPIHGCNPTIRVLHLDFLPQVCQSHVF